MSDHTSHYQLVLALRSNHAHYQLISALRSNYEGEWGPYLRCNPVDVKAPDGPWNCTGGGGGPSPTPSACSCPRVYETVGKENLTMHHGGGGKGGGGGIGAAGGNWFSHPINGKCKDGEPVGTNGCTWRVIERNQIINASCMYSHIDAAVEAKAPSCFQACPQPTNVSAARLVSAPSLPRLLHAACLPPNFVPRSRLPAFFSATMMLCTA